MMVSNILEIFIANHKYSAMGKLAKYVYGSMVFKHIYCHIKWSMNSIMPVN